MSRRAIGGLIALIVALGACSGDDDVADPSSSTDTTAVATSAETTVSTTVPTFTGDPDSPFCDLIDEGETRPVLSPFEPGIEPGEVELRMRNLRNRFDEFADAAPPDLEADLDALVVALADTDAALATHDYDFAAMAEAGVTVSTFDDPVFEIVAFRLAEYRTQVCA